jgi:hypothetical protein
LLLEKKKLKKFLSLTAIIIAILMAYSNEALSQLETTERTHFIVLIRDTGLMNDGYVAKKMIVPTLPKLLFEGGAVLGDEGSSLNPPLPVYHSDRDHISVVFVAVHTDNRASTECKSNPALSVSPQHFFQWQSVEQGQDQEAFTQSLSQWIDMDCRAQGNVSSSVLAETMSLPYVHSKLADEGYGDLQFSRTILVLLGNDAYYGGALPSRELFLLKREHNVRDIETAARSIEAVNSAFHIVTPPDWVFTINHRNYQFERGNTRTGYTLKYRLAEVLPLDTNVDNYIDYSKQVQLDRVAISNDKLQLVQQQGGKGVGLRLLPSDRLRPDKIELSFADQSGGDWQIGQYRLPPSIVIDIADCIKCELRADGVIYVPLLGVVIDDFYLTPNAPELSAGQIRFKVRFRYNANEVYDHHYVDTDWKTVDIQPVKPFVIPKSWLFPKIVLDNKNLADEYDSSHSEDGLTQKFARERIVARRKKIEMTILGFLVGFFIAILLVVLYKIFHKFAYRRPFQPVLDWNRAKKIDIDFDQQPGARLLVGIVNFKNEGRIPWFGRLVGNKDYPDYKVEFSLRYRNEQLKEGGFSLSDGVPLGFRGVGENAELMREIEHRVSHETPIYIFLATDVIRDFEDHQSISGSRTVTFGGEGKDFQISVDLWRGKKRLATKTIEFDIDLIPEQAKPPLVTYHPAVNNLEFKKSERVEIGTFKFESQAGHHFAHSFEDKFNLRSYKDNLPLANDNAVALSDGKVVVLPFKTSDVDLAVLCDGEVIPNPEPPSQDYSFNLLGEFAPGSKASNHWFSLCRDSTRADLHLEIIQSKKTHRIHWDQQEHPICRLVKDRIVKAKGELLDQDVLELPPYFIEFDADTPESTVFKIHIGNTGKAGLGWIKANLDLALNFKRSVRGGLKLKKGYRIEDSLVPVDNRILIKEGDEPEIILVQVDAAIAIEDIVGGRIDPDGGLIEARLDIEVQDDEGARENRPPRERHLVIRAPIGLEKLPHQNWLCIDFGTSAIVAAIGLGDEPYILPLQKVVSRHDDALNFEDYDLDNTESGTEFLPSPVICDADLRQKAAQDSKIRRGFPRYQPASLRPGDPDFIGLPATMRGLREYSGRVIYSLKSWLAQPSDTILLQDTAEFEKEDGEKVERNRLPLEEMVESGFAALAEGYITAFDVFEKGGQVILSHPNTFTDFHKQKLHDIAWRALNQRLGIALPERIRLISESDAVAYHYCRQRMSNNQQRTGWERLLVYDFGAGTLDLSLVHVHWSREGVYPKKWQVENRLGVPIAGNHIDRLLARLVDQCLKDESVLNPAIFEYRYPVVGQLRGDDREKANRRLAAYRLWQAIRQTKHAWDGKEPFRVRVGAMGATELIFYKGGDVPAGDVDKPSIEQSGDEFYLRIPSQTVHDYPLLQEFIEFVTDTVVDELLQGIAAKEVDTVVVSGRGALWSGLRDRVWGKFPDSCEKPDLTDGNHVKSAVVSGAIAWQSLTEVQEEGDEKEPRLAILREDDKILVPEEDWESEEIKENGIDLRATSTFSLVQVSHQHPDPRKDLNSLRCHFYIQLEQYRLKWKWGNDPRLFVRREGKTIRVENAQGEGYDFKALGLNSRFTSIPPWPIGGDGVLPPKELYY